MENRDLPKLWDLTCPKCGFIGMTDCGLWSHTRDAHPDPHPRLPDCNSTATTNPGLANDQTAGHVQGGQRKARAEKNSQKCPLCDEGPFSFMELADHSRKAHKTKPSPKCTMCDKSFSNKKALRRHSSLFHPLGEDTQDSDSRQYDTTKPASPSWPISQQLAAHTELPSSGYGNVFEGTEELEEHQYTNYGGSGSQQDTNTS